MTANIDKARISHNADVKVDRVLENLVNVRRLEGIIDFYRLNGAPSGEIALAVVEFVKRGDEGLGMVE
jgi:hypothetical protein